VTRAVVVEEVARAVEVDRMHAVVSDVTAVLFDYILVFECFVELF
jgi:hypothetical protein